MNSLPTFSVHIYCTACGGSGVLGDDICHCQRIDITKAVNHIVARNHAADPNYAPYCGRCSGLVRMTKVEPFYWRHSCGAEHDERACIVPAPTGDSDVQP